MMKRLFGTKPEIPKIDVATLATERFAGTGIQIVDEREPDEWAAGRMADADLIPLAR